MMTAFFRLQSCSKTESDFTEPLNETINVAASILNATTGTTVSFTVLSSINSSDVTANSKIYVNGALIAGNTHAFTTAGTFAVYATKGSLTSNVIAVNAIMAIFTATYRHNVLVEEYSGTWCGNCPRILYGVDLLHKQTDKAIVISTLLFNGDSFISNKGNNLADQQEISGVPSGFINRTTSWNTPQYENVAHVISTIKTSAPLGIGTRSSESSNNLSFTVNVAYTQILTGGAKLTVNLVEDKLLHT